MMTMIICGLHVYLYFFRAISWHASVLTSRSKRLCADSPGSNRLPDG